MRYYKSGFYGLRNLSALLLLCLMVFAAIPISFANAQFVSSSRDPVVVGHVIDIPPFMAIGDSVGSGALISNINGTLQKAILEYDITDIMPGVLESARITGQVGPQNNLPAGERVHTLSTHAGDGVLSTADNDGTGFGSGGIAFRLRHEAGSQTPYDYVITGGFRAAVLENTGYLRQEISSPQSNEQGVDEAFSTKLELVLRPTTDDTTVYYQPPSVGGEATATDSGSYSVDLSTTTLDVTDEGPSPSEQSRGIMEFDLSSIPPTAEILWAVLDVDIIAFSRIGFTGTTIDIAGYQGDGVITADDVMASTELLGTTPQILELGIQSWTLDPQYIETVLQSGDHLGLLLEPGDNRGLLASVLLVEGRFSNGWDRPHLAIAYTTSSVLKGDVNQDAAVNFLDIAPFIAVLAAAGNQPEADCECDGDVDFLDIAPFIAILSSQ